MKLLPVPGPCPTLAAEKEVGDEADLRGAAVQEE